MTLVYEYDGPSFETVEDLRAAVPEELWMSWKTRVIDGGYPGEGCVVDDLVITTDARGGSLGDLKHDASLTVVRRAAVREWHADLVRGAEKFKDDDLMDVFYEVDEPTEAEFESVG